MKYVLTNCPNCGLPCGIDEYDASATYATITTVTFKCPGCLFYFDRHFDKKRLCDKLAAMKHHYDLIDEQVATFVEHLITIHTPADLIYEAVKQDGTRSGGNPTGNLPK